MSATKPILVLGLGNPLLSDDAIGLLAVQAAESALSARYPAVDFKTSPQGTFDLLHEITGYTHALIIDSIRTDQAEPGFCHEFAPEDFTHVTHASLINWHSLNLPTLLATGSAHGFALPATIVYLGIEGREFTFFCEQPTLPVKQAIPRILEKISIHLDKWHPPNPESA